MVLPAKSIYERICDAVALRSNEQYTEAYQLFDNLAKDIPSDPFFRQQMALCIYKQRPLNMDTLDKALSILAPLSDTIDPETNGLTGAIYKRRFEFTQSQEDIDMAINSYKKAYHIYGDYYTGENYAFCLLLKRSISQDDKEKDELKIISIYIYREVYKNNKNFDVREINTEYEIWTLATLAACSVVLNNQEDYKRYESLFLSKATSMMKTSYQEQMGKLRKMLNSKATMR